MNSTTCKKFRLAVASDIHFGHRRVPAAFIAENWFKYVTDELMASLDMFVLAGDVYDRLLALNNHQVYDIDRWIYRFCVMCKQHDVTLFILEGTESHDREQSERFVLINEAIGKVGAKIRYIRDLTVWYEERFDMNFLFVPDEWHHDPKETLRQVHTLLETKHLTQVDFSFMHGNFGYQLPLVSNAPKHDEQSYLDITKHLIFIGHVHTRSQYERIHAQGSFDRLKHNEEEAKGFLVTTLYENGQTEVEFIENLTAKRFDTIDCLGLTVEETLTKARHHADQLPNDSYLRLYVDKTNPIVKNLNLLKAQYPLLTWSLKEDEGEPEDQVFEIKRDLDYQPVYITPDNVLGLVQQRLSPTLPPDLANTITVKLNELIEALKR